ncbi:MAG: hypothetical protein ABWY93_04785 [Mycobacterium sp.]
MRRQLLLLAMAALLLAALALAGCTDDGDTKPNPQPSPTDQDWVRLIKENYVLENVDDPQRTLLRDTSGRLVFTLTRGARTVVVRGPLRTFTESSTTDAEIRSTDHVYIAPRPWDGNIDDQGWARFLIDRLHTTEPDLLEISLQYLAGSPTIVSDGQRIAGDAGFGLRGNGDDRDGADFYDYLNAPWKFPDRKSVIQASTKFDRQLDCSGYLRLVYGFRSGIPLFYGNGVVDGLPRSAWAMADHAPSVVVASSKRSDSPPDDLSRISPGDAVFFALHDDRPGDISHSGIYLGRDNEERMRFVSARSTANGPTFGDLGGDGVIDDGYFGDRLRRAIRF